MDFLPKYFFNFPAKSVSNPLNTALYNNNYKAGLHFGLPLFLRQARGDLKQAKIKIDQQNLEIGQTRLEIENKIAGLERQLIELKAEYSRMIYNSSKLNRGLSIVAFVFSSSNFNQLYMRLKYLRQYTASRKKQAEQIEKLTA